MAAPAPGVKRLRGDGGGEAAITALCLHCDFNNSSWIVSRILLLDPAVEWQRALIAYLDSADPNSAELRWPREHHSRLLGYTSGDDILLPSEESVRAFNAAPRKLVKNVSRCCQLGDLSEDERRHVVAIVDAMGASETTHPRGT